MDNILEISNLKKTYDEFILDDISLTIPKGCIMGLVGQNGAGKSTTIKLILNMIQRDQGEIKVFGLDNRKDEMPIKELLGVVFEESSFPENMNALNVNLVMKHVYLHWSESTFKNYLKRFDLPSNKIIKAYSRGMKMKLAIAVALSHSAKLLVLDEPTSGLDPMIRDEILDIFLEFIQDETQGILISSHIISDLEKVADYISLLHNGKLMLNKSKDNLLEDYVILKCSKEIYQSMDKSRVIGCRKNQFGVELLVDRDMALPGAIIDRPSLEDIMLYHVKGVGK
jgi:ABC-2 type transport system ATP-binding protein